jgi:hypothetical protein
MDDRPDSAAPPDDVVFAPARVRGPRSPRIVASVVALAIAALIAVGALNREPASEEVAVAPPAPAVTAGAQTVRPSRPPRPSVAEPGPSGDPALGAVFDLDVRPAGSHLFVHGDVFSLAVTRVRVTVADAAGHVAERTSVAVPGGSRSFLLGAVPRFDVHFILPDEIQADGFVVSAVALDAKGRRVARLEERIPRAADSM